MTQCSVLNRFVCVDDTCASWHLEHVGFKSRHSNLANTVAGRVVASDVARSSVRSKCLCAIYTITHIVQAACVSF